MEFLIGLLILAGVTECIFAGENTRRQGYIQDRLYTPPRSDDGTPVPAQYALWVQVDDQGPLVKVNVTESVYHSYRIDDPVWLVTRSGKLSGVTYYASVEKREP